ncbi:hypothetical protein BJY52DRAFT_1192006 [Lactarius psammicola]|nr:hypothetical protein BJY52DRAFT_1192006 [Lactarius psammicola]
MSYSFDPQTRSSVISSRYLPAISRSLTSTSPTFPFHPAFNSHPQHSKPSRPSIYRPSYPPPKMYYDDHDPRIGPAAMPPPRSEYAPYYSGYADAFEDFLDEFEGRAYDCELTDPQRVDAIIRYVDPSIRELCRSLNGFRPRNWPVFRQSLLDTFGRTTPRPQVMRQKLQCYIQNSSRSRMDCIDDVLQYYRQFLCYSAPLVHAGHLTEEDRDAAFWRGFHPEDCKVLWPRLIGKNPIQPPDTPFYFEDVFHCARAAFAYDGASLSWSPEYQFKPSSVRREQPVAEHVSRDTCGPREVSRAVVSNAEMENTHSNSELLSPSTPDPQLPLSSSLSALELQHSHMRSATVNQPEDALTFSNPTSTLPISSSLSASEFQQPPTHSATVNQPEHESKSSISLSTLLPSISPFLTSSPSLAPSIAEDDPERAPTFSNSPSTFLPSTPSVRLTPSTADDDPEHAPTFSDSSFIPLPSTSPAPTRSLAHSVADDVSEIISTPFPMSTISSDFECLSSEKEEQLESELASMSSSTPASLPLQSTPLFSSRSNNDVPELASAPPSSFPISSDPECVTSARLARDYQPEPMSASTLPIPPKLYLSPRVLSPIPNHLSASLSVSLPHDQSPFLSDSLRSYEFKSTPVSTVDVVPPSSPESSPSSLGEIIPHTSDANPRTCTLILPLGVTSDSSVSSPLEIALVSASPTIPPVYQQVFTTQWLLYLVPQLLQEPSLVYEASSTPVPHLSHYSPLRRLSGSRSAHFVLALTIVTTAALVSVFINVFAIILTHAREFGSKNEDLGDSQNGTPKSCNSDTFAQRRQLRQYTPHALRLVFDPGGSASTHEDVRKHKSKTRGGLIITQGATLPTPILAGNLIVFVVKTLKFFQEGA